MKDSLKPGLAVARRFEILRESTIDVLGEDRRVYATPAMVRDIEIACLEMIAGHLDDGEATVGMRVAVDHLGASLEGSWVEIGATIAEIDGRRIVLDVEVRDPVEVVGKGRHVRFVVDLARQAGRVDAKRAQLAGEIA